MRKLFVLVSCFALLLVLSNVNFAQEVVADEATPCTCCYCAATSQAFPFAYPPYVAPKTFGSKLAGLAGKCPLAPKAAIAPTAALPLPPPVYAAPAPEMRPFAARRAARLAQQQPLPPFPPAVAPAPPVFAPPAFAPPMFGAAEYGPQFPAAQMGDSNKVLQRAGGAPVISFFSIVRSPRPAYDPYAAYYYQQQYGYPQPAVVPVQVPVQ